jgi:hypothetical protein
MKKLTVISMIVLLAIGCKKAFAPVAISSPNSFLVIEGVINSGSDSTYFRLSRTIKLSARDTVKAENNAIVTVEGNDNTSYPLSEIANGIYSAPALGLNSAAKYRLRIKTTNNEEYLSDYVETKVTPPVDSITYTVENDGVQFYASTHDPNNAARYYRWDFSETWGYFAYERSYFVLGDDGLPRYREGQKELVYECYQSAQSHQVLLASSANLAQDVINKQPLDFITAESGKVSHGYSVLFRQYALTQQGYTYWQQLKKNTEEIGTIFDAQPSEIPSNIHCISDHSKPVIGFITACNITSQRIFVDAQRTVGVAPFYLPPPTPIECDQFFTHQIFVDPVETFKTRLQHVMFNGDTVITVGTTNPNTGKITSYVYVAKQCADCRAKAPFGTNAVPVFWPMNEHY